MFREAAHDSPLYEPGAPQAGEYLAIVTDREERLGADGRAVDGPLAGARVLRLADDAWLTTLADLVERAVMGRGPA